MTHNNAKEYEMDAILIKEVIIGIIMGIGMGAAWPFIGKAQNVIEQYQKDPKKNSRAGAVPFMGIALLIILTVTGVAFYLSQKFGIEPIYPAGDERTNLFLGPFGRFNLHVIPSFVGTWILYAFTIKRLKK